MPWMARLSSAKLGLDEIGMHMGRKGSGKMLGEVGLDGGQVLLIDVKYLSL